MIEFLRKFFKTVKLNRTRELERLNELGISSDNVTLDSLFAQRQTHVDKQFEESAAPVFIGMLLLSCATFVAAFIQVIFKNMFTCFLI